MNDEKVEPGSDLYVEYEAVREAYDMYVDEEKKEQVEKVEKGKERPYDIEWNASSGTFTVVVDPDVEYGDDFQKEVEEATNEFMEVQTETYKKAVKERIGEFTKEFLPSILGQSETFNLLSDNIQGFINVLAQSIDPTEYKNADEYGNAIFDMFIKPLADMDKEIEIDDGKNGIKKVDLQQYLDTSLAGIISQEAKGVEITIAEKMNKDKAIRTAVSAVYDENSDAFKTVAGNLGYKIEYNKQTGKIDKITNSKGEKVEISEIKEDVYDAMAGVDDTAEN